MTPYGVILAVASQSCGLPFVGQLGKLRPIGNRPPYTVIA